MSGPGEQSEGGPETPDIAELVADLERTAAARRAAGSYPPGLEDDLEAHFRRIVTHRVIQDLGELDTRLDRLLALPGLTPDRIGESSDLPGGAVLHRAIGRVLARQAQGILEQVEEVAGAVKSVLEELVRLIRQPNTHLHPDLIGQVDAVQERLSALERQPAASPAGAAELSRRVEGLEAREAARRFRPSFSWRDFDDEFRGTREEIKDRYRDLVGQLDGAGPVMDIGCGRGEFLELLAEAGVEARGVELDAELAADASARGLDVEVGDGLEALGRTEDASLGGLVLVQVVEHLGGPGVLNLVSLAADKLRPGGRLVIETVNPQSLYVYARAFYLDPTHDRPIHPLYLRFLARQAGFRQIDLQWRSPPPAGEELSPVGDPGIDANLERINAVLFAPQDYALVAVR